MTFDPAKVKKWVLGCSGYLHYPDPENDVREQMEFESLGGPEMVLARDYDVLLAQYNQFKIAKPISEWHEDLGPCLWWIFPICEPPYSGTPLDCNWPEYHTHFTRLTNEMCPVQKVEDHEN
jgi:hypothetical protein